MNRAYRDYCRHMGEAVCRRPIFTDPTLNQEELLAVYQTAKSTDLDILRDTAVRMFPSGSGRSRPSSTSTRAGPPRSGTTGWSPGLTAPSVPLP